MSLVGTYQDRYHTPFGDNDIDGSVRSITITDADSVITGTFKIVGGIHEDTPFRGLIRYREVWFTMEVIDQVHVDFWDALSTNRINRFIIEYRVATVLRFKGVVNFNKTVNSIRNTRFLEGSSKYNQRLTLYATDGIVLLEQVDYRQSDGTPFAGRVTINNFLADIFAYLPSNSTTQDLYLISNMNPNTSVFQNFWVNVQIDRGIYSMPSPNGGYTFMSCWDVLQDFCSGFDYDCYHQADDYVFENRGARINGGSFGRYGLDGILRSEGTFAYFPVSVDNSNRFVLDPDIRKNFAPCGQVIMEYLVSRPENYLLGESFNRDDNVLTDEVIAALPVPVPTATARLRWRGRIQFIPKVVTTPEAGAAYRLVFFFEIKLGSQYYVRDLETPANGYYNNSNYTVPEWTSTAGWYVIPVTNLIILPDHYDLSFYKNFFITTLEIPASLDGATLSVKFGHVLYDETSIAVTTSKVEHWLEGSDLIVKETDNNLEQIVQRDIRIINPTTVLNPRTIKRKCRFGTGVSETSISRLTDTSVPPVNITSFTNDRGTFNLSELVARSIISREFTGDKIFAGSFRSDDEIRDSDIIDYDSIEWVPQRVISDWEKRNVKGVWREYTQGDESGFTLITEDLLLRISEIEGEDPSAGGVIINLSKALAPVAVVLAGAFTSFNVDTVGLPVRDTTGLSTSQIQALIELYPQGGLGMCQLVSGSPVGINQFSWNNSTRTITMGEQIRSGDILIARTWI